MAQDIEAPHVSIVIPVYNEEVILRSSVEDLVTRLEDFEWSYELLLVENGSSDATREVAAELERRFPQVRQLNVPEPNYGLALRTGISQARGTFVLCDEIDLCDTEFYREAMAFLEAGQTDFVVGSKTARGAADRRPLIRRAGTLVISAALRLLLGFQGTDTHGLKAFRRQPLMEIVDRCLVDRDLFASELVIRSERARVPIREIPVRVIEKRPPSVHLFRRVPNVLLNLGRLFVAIRIRG